MGSMSQIQAKRTARVALIAAVLGASGAGAAWWSVSRGEPMIHAKLAGGTVHAQDGDQPETGPEQNASTTQNQPEIDVKELSIKLASWDPKDEPDKIGNVKPVTPVKPGSSLPELLGVIVEHALVGADTRFAVVLGKDGKQSFLARGDTGDGFSVGIIGEDYMIINVRGERKRIDKKEKRPMMLGSVVPSGPGALLGQMTEAMRNQMEQGDMDSGRFPPGQTTGAASFTGATASSPGAMPPRPGSTPPAAANGRFSSAAQLGSLGSSDGVSSGSEGSDGDSDTGGNAMFSGTRRNRAQPVNGNSDDDT